ncbi:BREX system P-loop protein BrxC [Azospirillum brasilense]|uniref:BREX system P-loop protein BrxC n=1 Tax=Azospirillum brasilense TaxID=192 RepID=UPI00190C45FF|nr:BREX system P-loop protein BrxC [Azospirillum brasilense]MBK3732780.1 BREX system P-loop protein BrxC [Azospirillum brasilense]
MTAIRSLFDPDRDINRSIEKVITYQASQEERLRAEITEYVVTDRIEEQLERLLERMQAAMDSGGGHEIGVWVSGFYGSGKSSFTKYLGLAFDGHYTVDGQPFLKHLQNRVKRAATRALLSAVASRFPAAVVMLDLASEQVAGASLVEVSTVLYYKVLQYAGYSRNLKIAAFERKLKKDGRYSEFESLFYQETGDPWKILQNDPIVADAVLPVLAHRMYPALFRTDHAFTTTASDVIYLMDDRVTEMLDLVRDASGKENIIFIIDEIGQYVGGNKDKILDLQGLAQNLKDIGGGKVWIVGTAQQTLTEDDPRVAINSPELFKLKDRFPITVELESSDIREICYRRLLGKSPAGEDRLKDLYDRHGAQLRHNTRLVDAKSYSAALDRDSFVNLYPFLPAHFDILLHLLGALAKSTGGIGLRSAIKVVQDILVEGTGRSKPVADQALGWLATTVTLFDSLDRDILRAYPQIHQAVKKTLGRVGDDTLKQNVAKTIAILQILNNLPANAQNVASLMHPSVDSNAMTDEVKVAVDEMLKDQFVPLMEKDGNLRFFSEKLNDIEQERGQIAVRTQDFRRLFNTALRELFDPLPTVKVHESLSVTSGIRHLIGGQSMALAGEREAIQTQVAFADAGDYDAQRTRLLDESRERANETAVYLLGRTAPGAADLVTDIYRCERIAELHRNDPDQEVREYCASQAERVNKLMADLRAALTRSLTQGSFLFRGRATAVDSLDQDLGKAARTHLVEVAAQVFDRYPEAPVRVDTALAEKFLRQPNLRSITSQLDPLGLVELSGTPKVRTSHKGLVSIHDFIERTGTVEGKTLLEVFSGHPFGWSPDTLRYMVAALLLAAEIKLKVAGREVTVNGQQAVDALKTNTSFRTVGVSLRHDRPSMEVLAKAAGRLTELSGETVLPLEDEISKAARQKLPDLQNRLSPLSERLSTLGLPGADTMDTINRQIAAMLRTDASDAPLRFGAAESPLFEGLLWAIGVKNAFDQGLSDTIRSLREIARAIEELPDTGAPGELRDDVREDLDLMGQRLAQRDFHRHKADLQTKLTALEARISGAARAMAAAQKERLRDAEQDLRLLPEWAEFTQDEQAGMLNRLQAMAVTVSEDLAGLKRLLSRQFDIEVTIAQLKETIVREGRERRRERERPPAPPSGTGQPEQLVVAKRTKPLALPRRISTAAQLDALIDRLQALRVELDTAEFNVTLTD